MSFFFRAIFLLWLILSCFCFQIKAQDKTLNNKNNLIYTELPNPKPTDTNSWIPLKGKMQVSYADDQVRYEKERVPDIKKSKLWNGIAWKGEKIHTQALIWGGFSSGEIHFVVGDLKNNLGGVIGKENINVSFVRYILSDNAEDGCAHGLPKVYDSLLVADPIDIVSTLSIEANTVRPIWISVTVPQNTPAGNYNGEITIFADKKYELEINITVRNHILPDLKNSAYHLDLWQYPAPIAELHHLRLWSAAHFDLLKDYYTKLAQVGQKVITANIIPQPWGRDHAHIEDPSLIKWTKLKNGTWDYDFGIFDQYIETVMDSGIDQQINCYSMLSWDGNYRYMDSAQKNQASINLSPGSADYIAFWEPMLRAFTAHLKTRGWFERTVMALDERPAAEVGYVIALLKKVDENWKIALSTDTGIGELQKEIYDYSLASYLEIDSSLLSQRKAAGKITTFYTACVEAFPSSYTFSPPAENTWLAWHAAAKGYDGYLFWAFNSWVSDPLRDARWKQYPSGTLYQFYPGPRTSIRFEKLIAGIQDFEKIKYLLQRFKHRGEISKLKKLQYILNEFQIENLKKQSAANMLKMARKFINAQ